MENYTQAKKLLTFLAIKHHGNWDKILASIKNPTEEDWAMSEYPRKTSYKSITILDEEYPNQLRQIYRPPFVLFYKGDISLLSKFEHCLAIVGTREPSERVVSHTKRIIGELPKDIIIVSGLANGIDTVAHETALENNMKTIAVMPTGINYCYPSINRGLYKKIAETGLVISEYPADTTTTLDLFVVRNRIISGLCKTVFVPEAKIQSGTSRTVCFAEQQNRDICCLPGEINTDSLGNLLIKTGAYLVEKGDDIADIMGFGKLLFSLK